jgi:CyaY protein
MNTPQAPGRNPPHNMTESAFSDHVDRVLAAVEAAIDRSDADIDSELNGGILTLTFSNDSKIIINRQMPMREIWVAAKSGGFHFRYDGVAWHDTRSAEALGTLLTRVINQQSNEQNGEQNESVISITL